MNIEAIKEKVISFVEMADDSALERLSHFIDVEQSGEKDWWDETPDYVKASIEEGLRDVEEGRVVSYEDYKKTRTQWFFA